MAATRYEITNVSLGPLGFPEVGKPKETMIARGETTVVTVHASVAKIIEHMAAAKPPKVEASNLGAVQPTDHDGDDRMGGGRSKTPPPAPGKTPAPPASADGGLDFDSLTDDQLRSYLAGNEVQFHPNTGRVKLLAKAKEHEAEAATAAAQPPAETEEAV